MQATQLRVPNTMRAAGRRVRAPRASRALTAMVRADQCLIVNCKSGGHAFIGLHLAHKLLQKGHKVTILNEGDKVRLSD